MFLIKISLSMKRLITLLIATILVSCENDPNGKIFDISDSEAVLISSEGLTGSAPYFTKNQYGAPVLSWTEGEGDNTMFKFSVWDDEQQLFGHATEVLPARGLRAHQESMAKIAFKPDGTIVALYAVSRPTSENQRAGAIYFVQSFDDGKSWTEPQYLHLNHEAGIGRGFFDLTILPDGEIGAIWLDGRDRKNEGSTLFFSKTEGDEGFVNEKALAQGTCQCCRTSIFLDEKNTLHITYRHIFEGSIRDIAHLYSEDNGSTFSDMKRISDDNWEIDGCPHTGPAMAESNGELHIAWFTAGGGEGVYYTSTNDNGTIFKSREMISSRARNPQSTTLRDGMYILVWNELYQFKDEYNNRIVMQIGTPVENPEPFYLSSEDNSSSHAVLTSDDNDRLYVAWTRGRRNSSEVWTLILNNLDRKQ
jgi:hypothetical protein